MDLEETEFRNGCAGEGQQQFNRPTENELVVRQSPADTNVNTEAEDSVGIRHQTTIGEDIAD
jgi:hypothetical protein